MSEEHVQIVRRALNQLHESYESGDATDGLLSLCAPDVRLDATRRVFNPAVYDGAAGIRRAVREVCDAWEDFNEIHERFIDLGERVVVLQTIDGVGRVSKARVQQKGALIWIVRDGRVQSVEVFIDPREALRAVGLEE